MLTCPVAAARWLPSHERWIGAPPERFALREPLRFRSRLRRVPVAGELRWLDVRPGLARGRMRLGLLAFEARFALGPEPGVAGASRIGLVLSLANQLALVSGLLDRFEVCRLASEIAEQTLAALASAAEESERAARARPAPG